jgi:CspA family cold shock protein
MATGWVKAFTHERGFGFIVPDDRSADVFVHVRSLMNVDELHSGDRVSFEVEDDVQRGKLRAARVRVIKD